MKVLSLLLLILLSAVSAAALENGGKEFSALVAQAEQLVTEKKFGELAELAPELVAQRQKQGYANLSKLSERILSAGSSSCSEAGEKCSFFLKNSVLLSPSDPWVIYGASVLSPSYGDKVSHFFKALRYSSYSPTFFFKMLIVGGLGILVLLTSLLAVKLLFSMIRFEFKSEQLTQKKLVIFFALLVCGLPLGLMPTILLWSLVLMIWAGDRKGVFQLLLLSVGWLTFLPTAENILQYVNNPDEREVEYLLSRISAPSFAPQVKSQMRNPIFLATVSFREGNFRDAVDQFKAAAVTIPELSAVVYSRLAASQLAIQEFNDAKTSLDKARSLGLKSFESMNNEALIALGRKDLDAGRKIMDNLKDLDSSRAALDTVDSAILLDPVPLSSFSSRYLVAYHSPELMASGEASWMGNEDIVLPLSSQGVMGLFVVTLLTGAILGVSYMPQFKKRGVA